MMKVLVIVANGLRLSQVGCYGSEWVATPALDRLAAEGVVFDQHHADCPDAAAARRAWRTGRYQLPTEGDAPNPLEEAPDLLRYLREQGIATRLVLDGDQDPPGDFLAGWEQVDRVDQSGGRKDLEQTLAAVGRALTDLAACDRWLLWVELTTLLPPWRIPREFLDPYFAEAAEDEEDDDEEPELLTPLLAPAAGPMDPHDDRTFLRLQTTYAAAVTYLDAGLDRLLTELRDLGLADQLLLAVTSDRGLPLGEHGVVGECRPWLHEELVHLPLLLRLPGAAEAGWRVSSLTQSVDLLPTLIGAFGLPVPATHGHSLLPLVYRKAKQIRSYACSGLHRGESVEWALRTPEWAFLLPHAPGAGKTMRGPQLYVKPDDRWEVNNVVQHHLELADHLEAVLRGFVAASHRPGPLEPPELRDVQAESAGELPPDAGEMPS